MQTHSPPRGDLAPRIGSAHDGYASSARARGRDRPSVSPAALPVRPSRRDGALRRGAARDDLEWSALSEQRCRRVPADDPSRSAGTTTGTTRTTLPCLIRDVDADGSRRMLRAAEPDLSESRHRKFRTRRRARERPTAASAGGIRASSTPAVARLPSSACGGCRRRSSSTAGTASWHVSLARRISPASPPACDSDDLSSCRPPRRGTPGRCGYS
jgi:hypothetical protein